MLLTQHIENYQLPELFLNAGTPEENSSAVASSSPDRWVEFVAHLSQFSQFDISDTKENLNSLLKISTTEQQATLFTGIAKCQIAEGLFLKAAQTLGHAFSLVEKNNRDVQSFIMLEMVNLLTVIGNRDQALSLLNFGASIAESSYLKRIYNYYALVNNLRNGKGEVLQDLINSGQYFEENNQLATLAFHHKNIGNYFSKQQEFDKASNEYNKAITITEKNEYTHIKDAILHDVGMLNFRRGQFDEGMDVLTTVAKSAQSYYTQCYSWGNLGFINFKKSNYNETVNCFLNSYEIASKYGNFHLIPGICYYLGKSNEQLKNDSFVEKYYSEGYAASKELARHNFKLNGEKLMVMDAYVEYLQENKKSNVEPPLSFAIGKTLKEIRSTFQHSFLSNALENSGSVKETVKSLNMGASTYSKIMNRVSKEIVPSSQLQCKELVNNYSHLNWKDANLQFEKDVLEFLHKDCEYNKRKLSEQLNVNYSRLVSKMNSFSSIGAQG